MPDKKTDTSSARAVDDSPFSCLPVVIMSLLLGSFAAFALFIRLDGNINWKQPSLWIAVAAFTLCGMPVMHIVWKAIDSWERKLEGSVSNASQKKAIFIFGCLVTLIAWIASWLAAWPGFFCYDTIHFISYAEQGVLYDQQSVLHTLLVGSFLRALYSVTGSWNAGIAAYEGFQIALLLAGINYALYRLLQWGCHRFIVAVLYVYYALNPIVLMLGVCSTKDVLLSFYLLMLIMIFYEQMTSLPLRSASIRRALLAILFVFLAAAQRTNVYYALAVNWLRSFDTNERWLAKAHA